MIHGVHSVQQTYNLIGIDFRPSLTDVFVKQERKGLSAYSENVRQCIGKPSVLGPVICDSKAYVHHQKPTTPRL